MRRVTNYSLMAKIVITFVATLRFGWLSMDFFTAYIPSAFGIPMYNDFISSDTWEELCGTNFKCVNFL